MASGPITSWQIDGETVETVTDFILRGSKIQMVIAAMKLQDACSLEKKVMTNLLLLLVLLSHFSRVRLCATP